MRSRAETLEFTLLGLLSQSPLHGYEIRKRLSAIYGPFRALSFSVLYPQLRRMLEAGLIAERVDETTRRSRIVYTITKAGEKKFSQLTDLVNPESWEDDGFEAAPTNCSWCERTWLIALIRVDCWSPHQ